MFMNGPRRHGVTRIVGAQTSALAWRIETATNGGGPVVGRDGTVYQGTDFGELLAIRRDGTMKWTVQVAYAVNSTPAILLDSRIAFVDEGGNLYVVNVDGSPSWAFHTGTAMPSPSSSPAIGRDGTIYTGIAQKVYAFHPDGSVRWIYDAGQNLTGTVSIAPDGTVYFPMSTLFAVDSNGSLLWESEDRVGLGGAPVVGSDGTIYVNAHDPVLYAFNPDGTLKWSYVASDCCTMDIPSSPAIARDGTIYVGEGAPARTCLPGSDLGHQPRWNAQVGVSSRVQPHGSVHRRRRHHLLRIGVWYSDRRMCFES